MIRKSGNRFSEKIMLKQRARIGKKLGLGLRPSSGRSEAHILVHVKGVEYRDARLIGLDRRPAMPAHFAERMIRFEHDERISDIWQKRYRLHRLQTVGADMHQAFERGLIKCRAERFLAAV